MANSWKIWCRNVWHGSLFRCIWNMRINVVKWWVSIRKKDVVSFRVKSSDAFVSRQSVSNNSLYSGCARSVIATERKMWKIFIYFDLYLISYQIFRIDLGGPKAMRTRSNLSHLTDDARTHGCCFWHDFVQPSPKPITSSQTCVSVNAFQN